MNQESDSVRIARIEERMIRVQERISDNHNELMSVLTPLTAKVQKHQTDITILKRDRLWTFAICAGALSAAGVALQKVLGLL